MKQVAQGRPEQGLGLLSLEARPPDAHRAAGSVYADHGIVHRVAVKPQAGIPSDHPGPLEVDGQPFDHRDPL